MGKAMNNLLRILLVEDNPADAGLIGEKLRTNGLTKYNISTVPRLAEAISFLAGNVVDAILLDLSLPDYTGLSGLQHLQQKYSAAPVIVLTACEDEQLALLAIQAGAQDYLYKDELSPQLLHRAIHYSIERHKSEERQRQYDAQCRTLLENNTDLIWSVDDRENIIYINSRAREYFGELYGVSISEGSNFSRILPPEQKRLFRKGLEKAKKGERITLSEFQPYGNASYFDLSIYPISGTDAKISGVSFFARDVTSRKLSKQSLLEHQAHLKGILETNMDYIVALDKDSCVLVYNEKAREFFRETYGHELEKGMAVLEVMDKGHRVHWEDICNRVLLGDRITINNIHLPLNGRYYDYTAYPIQLKNGEIQGITFFFRDVTERKMSDDEIRISEGRFTSLVETMHEGLTYASMDDIMLFCNDQFCAMTGYKKTELIGKNITDLLVPEDWKEFLIARKELRKQGVKDNYEFQLLKKNGKRIWILTSSTPMYNDSGEVEGIFSTHTDISEMKQAIEDVRKSETKYRTLLQTMHEGMVHVNNENMIQYANARFCAMTGYSEQDLIGRFIYDLVFEDEDRELIRQKTELRKLGIGDQYELRLRRIDQDSIWVLVNGSPVKDEEGKVIGAMGTFTDIQDMKLAEQKLIDKNEELNTFVYKASHDLKGPLASIIGLTNLASGEIQDGMAQEYFQLISKSTQRLDRILLELLQTVRIRHNGITNSRIDMPYIVEDVLQSISSAEGYDKIRIKKQLDHIPIFYSDKNLLISILQNIIDNAMKYHDCKAPDPYVALLVYKLGPCLKIEVEDNGPGISIAQQQKVFEMFYRGSLQAKGTGLGLYIAKNAVEKLNGEIRLESAEGAGTRFIITLPWINEEQNDGADAYSRPISPSIFSIPIEK
ncbi:MAG: PAS domain S-box protein [Bacteroidia bacterium]